MAEKSAIAWTRSTFNPWIGCTKIGPGCDACYAAVSTPARAMGIEWGAGKPRHRTSVSNWNMVRTWNRKAGEERAAGILWNGRPGYWPVFCASLADVFDHEIDPAWRRDLFDLIEETPNLHWLLVTKRIGNVQRMVSDARTHDWLQGRKNVRLLITVVNQEEADRDIPKLLALKCKNGISYEPALGPVNWGLWLSRSNMPGIKSVWPDFRDPLPGLEWIIVGGESAQRGHVARPFDVAWARDTVAQCAAAGVPAFVKQLGSNAGYPSDADITKYLPGPDCDELESLDCGRWHRYVLKDRAGADPSEWPEHFRVQEFPL